MDVDTTRLEEYPFKGEFYATGVKDPSLPLLEQEEETTLVLETPCDIQQASIIGNTGFKITSYNVYFPLPEAAEWNEVKERFGPIQVRRGLFFRADVWGYQIDGVVEAVGFSMLGGCVVQIKDRTE